MATPPWEQRFRAPVSYLPEWSPAAPGRAVYASNESGRWQIHTLDLERGSTRRVTDDPVGLIDAVPTLDGEGVLWFQDETGDESGRWLVQPFDGGDTEPFLLGVPHGWSDGLAQAAGIVVAAISDRDGFAVHVSADGAPAVELVRSSELDRPRRPRRRRVPARRSLAGRHVALSRARRARRPPPSLPSRRRPSHGRTARRADRRRHVARCALLVTGLGRPTPRVPARARGRRAPRALGSRYGRADEPRDRPRRHGLGRRLVPRRVGAPAGERLRGPEPSVPLRARVGRALPDRDRARLHCEGAGPARTAVSGCSTSRVEGGGSYSTTRGPRSSRSAIRHPRRARTSRGTSTTSTVSRCTASS